MYDPKTGLKKDGEWCGGELRAWTSESKAKIGQAYKKLILS